MQKNLNSIQFLRALAATSVVYYHIGVLPRFGSFGVDIFFVISGFVMAMIVANGQGTFSFAINRLTRILPLYWILTTSVLVLATLKPELLNSTTANLTNYIKSILFIPYFKENGALHPMLAVGWTLNYEMFFYLCVWLVLLINRKIFIPLVFIFITLAYLFLGKFLQNSVLNQFFGSNLLFEFLFGIFAYEIFKRGVVEKFGAVFLILTTIFSYAFMCFAEVFNFEIGRILAYGIPSIFLVLSITALERIFSFNSSNITNFFVSIGDASYATYLSHFYVVEGVRKIAFNKLHLVNLYSPFGVLITISLSLLVGQVLYKFLDKPLSRKLKRKFIN